MSAPVIGQRRDVRSAERDTAIGFARSWATALTALHGIPPSVAARIAARRHGVDPADVFVEHSADLSRIWRNGSTQRPTARPPDRTTTVPDDTLPTNKGDQHE